MTCKTNLMPPALAMDILISAATKHVWQRTGEREQQSRKERKHANNRQSNNSIASARVRVCGCADMQTIGHRAHVTHAQNMPAKQHTVDSEVPQRSKRRFHHTGLAGVVAHGLQNQLDATSPRNGHLVLGCNEARVATHRWT